MSDTTIDAVLGKGLTGILAPSRREHEVVTDPVSWTEEIRSIIDQEHVNGGPFWSRADGNLHAPAGFSMLLVLNVLGELGGTAESDPVLAGAVDLLFQNQAEDGAFRYSPTSGKLACITGQALAGLARLGLAGDARAEAGYRWLLDGRCNDGGWRCPTVRLGNSPETDASNPGATLFVLDAFRFRRNTAEDEEVLGKGVDSLLRHWETRIPLGPCAFGIGSRFAKVEYPFWRYNLFYYVYVLSHYRRARADQRFVDALEQLRTHTNHDGVVVDAPPRAWQSFRFARRGKPSALATDRWLEIQRNLGT
ncbi:prenyltransferase [Amycolatopsis benzoatilytica]|uniref:prenyltransferase n=1 Tax=Amycolatopsis benzoatilytica TaxID=346045 RepID=UPI0012B69DA6|nr:prenyltransferase [Amycolatopsis benzoatilytica]